MRAYKPRLFIILSTASSIEEMEEKGFFLRIEKEVAYLKDFFSITVYSNDARDYSSVLGVRCKRFSFLRKTVSGVFLYWVWLCLALLGKRGVAVLSGPSLGLIAYMRYLSGLIFVLEYKYDWAKSSADDFNTFAKKAFPRIIQEAAIRKSKYIFTTTHTLKESLKPCAKEKAFLVPNYVFLDLFTAGRAERKNQIVYVGRVRKSKGVDVLINAFLSFKPEHWELHLVGLLDKEYTTLDGSVYPNVIFDGVRAYSDVARLLRQSKIIVLPSLHGEGHPKALIEALSCGCVCLVSGVPGNTDMVKDGCNGFIFSHSEKNGLLKKLRYIIENYDDLEYIKKSAIESVSGFSFEEILRKKKELLLGFSKKTA